MSQIDNLVLAIPRTTGEASLSNVAHRPYYRHFHASRDRIHLAAMAASLNNDWGTSFDVMSQEKILIVEDEENERTGLAELVSSWGYRAETARDGAEGLEKVASWSPSIVVTDMKMPRMGGLELLEKIAAACSDHRGHRGDRAGHDRQRGASHAHGRLRLHHQAHRHQPAADHSAKRFAHCWEHESNWRSRGESCATADRLGSLVGASKKMQEIFRLIEMVAPSTASVLITGASGTGKELVARTIHELSPRRNKPFVPINCAAIPETLIESEIFGHEKGAFTGALERRTGCFELAEGGTLLLDEIGEMPVDTQAKLLRVLEDRKLRRLGKQGGNHGRCARACGHQQGSRRRGSERRVAQRSLLPAECF